jgi:hypothetical protein
MPRGSKAGSNFPVFFPVNGKFGGRDGFAVDLHHRQTVCSSENLSLNFSQKALFRAFSLF